MITALLAQGYNSFDAALFGVYRTALPQILLRSQLPWKRCWQATLLVISPTHFLAYRSDYFQTRRPVLWAALFVSLPASSGTWLINREIKQLIKGSPVVPPFPGEYLLNGTRVTQLAMPKALQPKQRKSQSYPQTNTHFREC